MAAQTSAITISLPVGGLTPDVRPWAAGPVARREMLLATSALALGLALSVAGPDHARAACVVMFASNIVDCTNTTTADSTNNNGGNSSSSARAQTFNSFGELIAEIQLGATINGAGMVIRSSEAGADVTMTHSGIVDQTTAGTQGGTGALRVQAAGGLLTYSGNGSVTTNQSSTSALTLENTTGDIVIGSSGTPVAPAYTATGNALQALTTGGGSITAYLHGGTVTGGDDGVTLTSASGSGNLAVTLTGGTTISAATYGVEARNSGTGNVAVTSDANVGTLGARTTTGLAALAGGASAPVTVTQTGGSIFASSVGINASNNGGGGVVVDQQAGTIDAGSSGTGIISIVNNATGGITITVGGGIVASSEGILASLAGTSNSSAISISLDAAVVGSSNVLRALHGGIGTITVDGAGLAQGGSGAGILAVQSGTGSAAGTDGVVIRGSGNTTATSGVAIDARVSNAANASNVLVERSGSVSTSAGTANAVRATTVGTGHVTVRNAASVTSFGGIGILASSAGGNVEVGANGAVQGGTKGIDASSTGAGTVTVGPGMSTVTALAGHAIVTSAVTGATAVTLDGAVAATGGNGVQATSGTGAVTITNNASITSSGAFAGVAVIGGTGNSVVNAAGGTISGQTGVSSAAGTGSFTVIDNSGTITGTGGTAVRFTAGTANVLFMNGAGAGLAGNAVGAGADTFRIGGTGTNTFDVGKVVSGFSTFEKTGSSTWTLTGTGAAAHKWTISAGTLRGDATSIKGTTITNDAALVFDQAAAGTYGGTISGTGTFTKEGAGALTLTGNHTFTGATIINAGTLQLGNGGAGGALAGDVTNDGALVIKRTGVLTLGSVISGTGTVRQEGSGTTVLSGTNTYSGVTTVDAGTLRVNGSIAASATTVNAGGILGGNGTLGNTTIAGGTLAPGNSIGTLAVQGNLTFNTASSYLVEVSPANADRTNVSGAATLAGTVNANFAPGTYLERTYTIVSAGTRTGTFDTLTTTDLPAGFTASMSYTGTEAVLNLTAVLAQRPDTLPGGGLNPNQRGVADTLNSHFNNGGSLPPGFVSVFDRTGEALSSTLTQISGESSAGSTTTALDSNAGFLGTMLNERTGAVAPADMSAGEGRGFAAEAEALPEEIALAYAKAMPGIVQAKAPPKAYEPRWSVWGSAYGGLAKVDGSAGTSGTSSRAGGFAIGADYRLWPDTVIGFALAGGGTSWSSASGSGRSDTFQAGVFGSHKFGAAYVSAALSYAWQDTTTTRTISIGPETLEGRFRPQVFAARGEAGYRFDLGAYGLTPYAAAQVQSFRAPAYTETATAGPGTFALSYASQSATATRTELGVWADHRQWVNAETELLLRGRAAWAHDFNTSRRINPSFVALPGASFTVDGAQASPDLALLTAAAELRLRNGVSLIARFDGEFGSRSESYAGTGTLRYSW